MAEQEMQRVLMKSPKSEYSRPVLRRGMDLYTMQSQRIAKRSLERVAYSLFSLEVILQIIAEREDVDEVEGFIAESVTATEENLEKELLRLRTLMKENGIGEDQTPEYTNPVRLELEITSPMVMSFATLLIQLDHLMIHIDTLWYAGVLDNRQRVNANHQWQQHLNKLASRIIALENRARARAHRVGKDAEVEKQVPRKSKSEDEQATGGEQHDPASDKDTPRSLADTDTANEASDKKPSPSKADADSASDPASA